MDLKLAFVGPRPSHLYGDYKLESKLVRSIRKEIEEMLNNWVFDKDIHIYVGDDLGIDQLCAQIAISYNIPYTFCMPCKFRERYFPDVFKKKYMFYLNKAFRRVFMTDKHDAYAMQEINNYICDECDMLVAVWDGHTKGRTKNCVDYAQALGKKVWIINPDKYLR